MFLLKVLEFINEEPKIGQSRWFTSSEKEIEVYLRNTFKGINGSFKSAIVIANIKVGQGFKCKGLASNLLELIYNFSDKDIVLIENVVNPALEKYCASNGWELYYEPGDNLKLSPCYFKVKV